MRIILLFILIGTCTFSFGQTADELDLRNGFKDIKLLSDINSYPGLEYYKADKEKEFHATYLPKKGSYDLIGEVEIKKLTVFTYKSQIYQIEVITDKNEKLFRSYEKAYGKIKYSMGSQVSYWEGRKVRLNYESENSKRSKLTYLSKEIGKIIALDKKKAVDSLSTEF